MTTATPREAASALLFYAWAAADDDSANFLSGEAPRRSIVSATRFVTEYLILRIWLVHLSVSTARLNPDTTRLLGAELQLQNAILCGFANRLAKTAELIRTLSQVEAHLESALSQLRVGTSSTLWDGVAPGTVPRVVTECACHPM